MNDFQRRSSVYGSQAKACERNRDRCNADVKLKFGVAGEN